MSKDSRLAIRITPELEAWLDSEAAARGLDKAAFARMVLFERMNGRAAAIEDAPIMGRTIALGEPRTYEQIAAALERQPYVPFEPQPEPEDLESIIERRVAARLAQTPQTYSEGQTGMHAHRRGLLPEYGGVANGGVAFRVQRHPVYGA